MKKKLFYLLLVFMLFPMVVNAASSNISAPSSVEAGNNVTAIINLKGVAAWNLKASGSGNTSGCSIHEVGDSGTGKNTDKSFKITCKATKIGFITFKYSGDVTSSDGKNINISGSKTINVVKPREKSNNNNLKSLSVDGSTLIPGFNKDTLEYTVELDSDVEKITINASKEDGYASIKGTGSFDVVEGNNKFEIVVTSETGNSKTYTINANVKDNNPIIKTLDGKEYSVVKRNSSLETPPKFTTTNVTINEKSIPAFYNEERDITLVGLKDDNGNIRYAKIDKETLEVSKYDTLSYGDKVIVLEDNSETVENYEKVSKEINGVSLEVYQNSKENDFILVYGMDLNTGNKNFYKYDLVDNTLQRYNNSVINDLSANLNNKLSEYKTILFVLIGLSGLLLVLFIVSVGSKSKMRKKYTKMINEKKKIVKEKE